MEGRLCLFGLPEAYRAFLRKHNGGVPDPNAFRWLHPSDGERRSHVDRLLGLDPRPLDDPRRNVDAVHVALKFRGFLPAYSLPVGFVDRDDLLVTFEHGPRLGQVWIKVLGELPVEVAPNPDPGAGLHFVAPSFTAFLNLLRQDAEAGAHPPGAGVKGA